MNTQRVAPDRECEDYVNNLWRDLLPGLTDGLSTTDPQVNDVVIRQNDARKTLLRWAWTGGADTRAAGLSWQKNPYNVPGLSPFGYSVLRAWQDGWTAEDQHRNENQETLCRERRSSAA